MKYPRVKSYSVNFTDMTEYDVLTDILGGDIRCVNGTKLQADEGGPEDWFKSKLHILIWFSRLSHIPNM